MFRVFVYLCKAFKRKYLLSRNIHDNIGGPLLKNITMQQMSKEEDKIFKVIDKVLDQIFGKEATHLIYRYLENNYSIKPEEISEKIDLFAKGLEEFLKTGAYAIERKILEDIYSSYGLLRRLEIEKMQQEYDFAGQIKLLTGKPQILFRISNFKH